MKLKFLSRYTLKQKVIALSLSVVMVSSITLGTVWGIDRLEVVNASRLSDSMAEPSEAFSEQKSILSKQAELWFIESQAKLQAGDSASALTLIQKAIKKDGELAILMLQRAAVYVTLADYDSAVRDYGIVLAAYPDYTMLYQLRGTLYVELDKPQKAYADYTRYLKDVPNDNDSRLIHTNLALTLKKYEDALSDTEKLLLAEPENGSLLALKGDILTLLSRPLDAVNIYLSALKHLDASTSLAVWQALGFLYQEMEDYTKAADAYQKYLSSNPDVGESWFQLGLCQIQTTAYTEAADAFTNAIRLNYETDLAHFQRGLCYYSLGKSEEAINDLEFYETSDNVKDASDAYIYLALSYADTGSTDQAITYFEKCIERNTMTKESHYYLGNLYLQKASYDNAVSHLTACIKQNFMAASCYFNRGVSYLNLDLVSDAKADFQSVIDLNSDTSLTASAQEALAQIDTAQQQAIASQEAAQQEALAKEQENTTQESSGSSSSDSANSSSTDSSSTDEQKYHTVIIKEGTLENPSAEINQSSEHTQTAE